MIFFFIESAQSDRYVKANKRSKHECSPGLEKNRYQGVHFYFGAEVARFELLSARAPNLALLVVKRAGLFGDAALQALVDWRFVDLILLCLSDVLLSLNVLLHLFFIIRTYIMNKLVVGQICGWHTRLPIGILNADRTASFLRLPRL